MNSHRTDFPILSRMINGQPIAYLDNASTAQKPQEVLDAITQFYTMANANTSRGVYTLAEEATTRYEDARAKVASFINAQPEEIVFTSGATQSINAVANAWALHALKPGDEILITLLEHHANILPWQWVANQTGALLRYVPIHDDGTLMMEKLPELVSERTKLIAVTHSSNAIGTLVDIAPFVAHARRVGARVLVDAAQTAPRQAIDVRAMDADFLVFSGHKMGAPTGVGVLFVAKRVHHEMQPYQRGGGMVSLVTEQHADFLPLPHGLEAGTPPIAQAIGLGAAVDYLKKNVDFTALKKHEAHLAAQLLDGLQRLPGIRILGPVDQLRTCGHLVSFVVDGIHAHDVAASLDQQGIAVRAGHHCAQPLAQRLGIQASVRISFYFYNTSHEVDRVLEALASLIHTIRS